MLADPTLVGTTSAHRRIDAKGRLTIPNEIRDELGLDAGTTVTVEAQDGEVVVKPEIDREDATELLEGCIDDDTRRSDAADVDPADLKKDWTSDLP